MSYEKQAKPLAPAAYSALLPCPFCGETPEPSKHFKHDMWQLIHRCEVIGPIVVDWKDSKEMLVEQWNTRRTPNQERSHGDQRP